MPRTSYPNPIRTGSRSYGGGESWTNWWLFPRLNDAQVEDVLEDYDLGAYYHAPGAPFSRDADVTHSRSYTLIRQSGGYDV